MDLNVRYGGCTLNVRRFFLNSEAGFCSGRFVVCSLAGLSNVFSAFCCCFVRVGCVRVRVCVCVCALRESVCVERAVGPSLTERPYSLDSEVTKAI